MEEDKGEENNELYTHTHTHLWKHCYGILVIRERHYIHEHCLSVLRPEFKFNYINIVIAIEGH